MFKRLFLGFEVAAPWPSSMPKGRTLEPKNRHLTLVFLGQCDSAQLIPMLSEMPTPPFNIGLTGYFDDILFLPSRHPNVVAWHAHWFDKGERIIENYYHSLSCWLIEKGFKLKLSETFLSHVTLCRSPFSKEAWREAFMPLPMIIGSLHLYESQGNCQYSPLWSLPIKPPFEEFEHTADIAFKIRGNQLMDIWTNAMVALAFQCPGMLNYINLDDPLETLDDVIMLLNEKIALVDQEEGTPFKAVSFHGDLVAEQDGSLIWNMIVDV